MAVHLPRVLDPLAGVPGGEPPASSWRWATVTGVGPVAVRLDGDSQPLGASPEWLVAGVAPQVGLRVWLQMHGRRVLVVGAAGPGASSAYSTTAWAMAPVVATGGSTWRATLTGIGWRNRIILHGLGRGSTWSSTGLWEISVPPDGTVIPGYGGSAGATVTAGEVPMAAWEVLYVELPPPGSGTLVPAGSYRLVGTSADFTLPESWLPVVAKNGDGSTPGYRTVTGEMVDYWRAATPANAWVNFGGLFAPMSYRKEGSYVQLRGVARSGLVNPSGGAASNMTVLPSGFRPEYRLMFSVASAVSGVGDAYGRVDVTPAGEVKAIAGGNVFMSLDGVRFRVYG